MKRKIWIGIGVAALVLLLAGVWALDIPHWKKLDEQLLTHLQSASVVYDRDGQEAFSLYGAQKRRLVALDDLPEYVSQAFVAAEDQRFYSHHGVDVKRILGATLNNIRSGSLLEGASTITQQLIKLTHLSSEKTFSRKIQEARLAIQAERVFNKREILEMYVNVVYFGGGAYGIDMASETYFGKRAAELSLSEAALLAGIIKSPNNYAPTVAMDKALNRRNYVLNMMEEIGYITAETAEAARNEAVQLAQAEQKNLSGWYRDLVIREAANALQISTEELLGGGYRIYTALDPEMQLQADECMATADAFPAADVEGALIAVDSDDGGIRAVCGGRSDDTRMGLNRATDSLRQPGSAIKPISVYAAAIDSGGWLPSDFIDDTQRVFSGGYMPRNAGDHYYGEVTLRTALSKSLNVATVSLAEQLGISAVRNYARRFGVDVEKDDASLSFALGSMTYGASPATLAGAYATLANGGTSVQVHAVESILDASGNEVYRFQAKKERVVSTETAALITDMLQTAATEGSARALSTAGIPVAGKTGTVAQDAGTRDLWTIAYTPEVSVAVWMGYDSAADGVMPESASGSAYPAQLAARWLSGVKQALSGGAFPLPQTLAQVELDRLSLEEDHQVLLATEHTPAAERIWEVFPADRQPLRYSARYEAPVAVKDAHLSVNGVGQPVIEFLVTQAGMEYLLMRSQDGQTQCIATLTGAPGETLSYTDDGASLLSTASYQVITRQPGLYDKGTLLTADANVELRFEPLTSQLWALRHPDESQPDDTPEPEEPLFAP